MLIATCVHDMIGQALCGLYSPGVASIQALFNRASFSLYVSALFLLLCLCVKVS